MTEGNVPGVFRIEEKNEGKRRQKKGNFQEELEETDGRMFAACPVPVDFVRPFRLRPQLRDRRCVWDSGAAGAGTAGDPKRGNWETSGTEKKELEEGKTSWGIVLAEFPREQVTMYGYLDPERPFQGVMIQCGDSVSYFPELVYMSDSHQMPDAVSDGSGSMFTVSFHAETGKDRKRDSLWVFLRSESGTMTADCFEEEDYLSQMANRFSLSFQKGEPEGTLLRQDGQALGKADLSWAKDAEITGLNISDRVCFKPGNPARLETEIGISAEGRKPYYGDELAVTAPTEIVVRTYEDGSRGAEFLIGEVEPLTEESLAEEREETGKIKDEAGEIKEEAEKGAGKTEEQGHSE